MLKVQFKKANILWGSRLYRYKIKKGGKRVDSDSRSRKCDHKEQQQWMVNKLKDKPINFGHSFTRLSTV